MRWTNSISERVLSPSKLGLAVGGREILRITGPVGTPVEPSGMPLRVADQPIFVTTKSKD